MEFTREQHIELTKDPYVRSAIRVACGTIGLEQLDAIAAMLEAPCKRCAERDREQAAILATMPSGVRAFAEQFEGMAQTRQSTARLVTCERCMSKVPERLATFGIGVRGGDAAWCAACKPQDGAAGESNRAEVIALRKARLRGEA